MILGIVSAGISLATEIVKLINTKEARKYLDRLVELKLEIQNEESLGYESDDARLESMYKELQVILEAVNLEVINYAKQVQGA